MKDEADNQPGESWVILGRLIRPQGRHGEVLSEILTDFPERFADRRQVWLISSENSRTPVRELALERHWLHKGRAGGRVDGRVVLKFAGIDSINDAEALRGLLVAVPASERAPLSDDSVYIGDLIGCQILDADDSRVVGSVTDVDREAGLLAVETPDREEVMIPFAKAYLVTMDLTRKRIEMRLPPGLLEINAPMTDEERHEQRGSDDD